ncbi:MAG: valine--tRNA ligase [Gammaproteobacteria bacterium]|nr:valine--tRNA ligase [Gammaproteobacteria bacterium]
MSAKKDLQKTYNPGDIESKWYARWESGGHFAPAGADAPPYCIMIPPPNVTGSLHMGHAFQDTIMDALIRYHRMRGRNTLWQPGTDHAGIATQMVVERILNAAGETRHDYGREKFTEKVWEWKAESGGTISRQLRRMGASPDWENERFTMDEGLCAAVNQVFVQLYEQGLIYRGKRLVNWDPALLTAVSDLEVVSEEESGVMYFVRYPFVDDEQNGVVIGTTRPETILVDGAIAVHPDDERFRPLLGRRVWVPMTEPRRAIEIIADEYVDPEFGSGCVKITAAHDFNDYRVYQRHPDKNIPLIVLLTPDAKMNDNAPERYRGLDRHKAREKIVADLREAGLLVREEAHRYKLPRGDRSGAVVEPMLTDQWFMDLTREQLEDGRPGGKAAIVEPAIEAVRGGAVEFVPQQWSKTYFQWLENLEDWCISRQIWWGHRIPAWYDDDGNIYVAANEAAVREKYKLPADLALRQEEDVLDTWFSSALWPFSTLGWPEKTARLKTFYPGSVLVTGFDIIFFWVARMIMMGCKFMDKPPFDQVYIHGLVRDAHGQKMSKSKGNVLDPIDLIDGIGLDALVKKRTGGLMRPADAERIAAQTRADFPDGIPAFGADALRFTFASLASTGRDINFDLGRTEGSRHFCNKIWNAARFVLMHAEEKDGGEMELGLADRWMLSKLQRAKTALQRAFETYRFDHAAKEIYELIWNHYCDWYLELCKPALQDGTPARKRGARNTLAGVLEEMLRLAHPFMPFLTEEIWQALAPAADKSGATIMTQPYPELQQEKIDEAAETEMERVIEITQAIRKLRSEHRIAPGKRVSVSLKAAGADAPPQGESPDYIATLARALLCDTAEAGAATVVAGGAHIALSLSGAVDAAEELARAERELAELSRHLERSTAKLANAEFVKKAPAAVVEKERARLAELETKRDGMTGKLNDLRARA